MKCSFEYLFDYIATQMLPYSLIKDGKVIKHFRAEIIYLNKKVYGHVEPLPLIQITVINKIIFCTLTKYFVLFYCRN